MEKMVNHYLRIFKFFDCRVTTVFHQYMAAFPSDYSKAEDLIFNSSITATLARVTKVMVKTAVEAINIPDRYDNSRALGLCKKASLLAKHATFPNEEVDVERKLIAKEVTQIMNAILELGNNSIAVGAIKAIEYGIIDIPWSPNVYNHNRVMGLRDINGAIRFLEFGNLPFSQEIKDFHFERIGVRKMMERDPSIFSLLEKDLSRIWKNDYASWPLDNNYVT
jgi:methylaspartate mutase epsilon subunit